MEKIMKAAAIGSKQLIEEYIENLSGNPKTEELLARYVDDPALKEHIRQTEAAFPGYSIDVEEMVAEGDVVAIRGTFHGVHKGTFAGVPPTGRQVKQEAMVFYRVSDGRIEKFWLQMDSKALMDQLTA
jgi:predicted ester cyclase